MSTARERKMIVAKVARHRAKTQKLISLRVCMLCKYPFISGRGANICLDCTDSARREWKSRHPHRPAPDTTRHASVRVMMVRSNLACPIYRASVNAAIPVPERDANDFLFKEATRKTFAAYEYPLGQKVLGWKSYPHLQFVAFKTGRPQEKVRRLTL